jgi:hypothetical protein
MNQGRDKWMKNRSALFYEDKRGWVWRNDKRRD